MNFKSTTFFLMISRLVFLDILSFLFFMIGHTGNFSHQITESSVFRLNFIIMALFIVHFCERSPSIDIINPVLFFLVD